MRRPMKIVVSQQAVTVSKKTSYIKYVLTTKKRVRYVTALQKDIIIFLIQTKCDVNP